VTEKNTHFEYHLTIEGSDNNAANHLASLTPLSKQQIKKAMQKGAVWLTQKNHTQRLRRADKTLQAGDQLHLYYDEEILASKPLEARIIADEKSFSIWYKPYGMYCQGSKWGDHCTINRWVEQQTQRPCFIVHRLDRAATGLIIIAHAKKTAAALAKLFKNREIKKCYHAIVHGKFPEQQTITINKPIDDRQAVSHIQPLEYQQGNDLTLVEVDIETGRKHQIRRHLAESGFPIVGDRLYGTIKSSEDLQLCCCYLAFRCPLTGEDKHYSLKDMLQLG
jgi:23S rRNA-/tRNA-specific pseudouridylate synthase